MTGDDKPGEEKEQQADHHNGQHRHQENGDVQVLGVVLEGQPPGWRCHGRLARLRLTGPTGEILVVNAAATGLHRRGPERLIRRWEAGGRRMRLLRREVVHLHIHREGVRHGGPGEMDEQEKERNEVKQ